MSTLLYQKIKFFFKRFLLTICEWQCKIKFILTT